MAVNNKRHNKRSNLLVLCDLISLSYISYLILVILRAYYPSLSNEAAESVTSIAIVNGVFAFVVVVCMLSVGLY